MDTKTYLFFLGDSINKNAIDDVSELNDLLQSLGIQFEVAKHPDYHVNYLSISLDKDLIKEKLTRNAGRKQNYHKTDEYLLNPTLGEVLEWKKIMFHKEIIQKIGCPEATYYRRWKYWNNIYNGDFSSISDLELKWKFF